MTCACTHYCPRCLRTMKFVKASEVECRCEQCSYRIMTSACESRKET